MARGAREPARLVRRYPDLLVRIERGDLTLSTIAILQGALTEETYEELVEAAAGKTKGEAQALLAKRFPAPDVPAAITVIPTQSPITTLGLEAVPAPAAAGGWQLAPLASADRHPKAATSRPAERLAPAAGLDLFCTSPARPAPRAPSAPSAGRVQK